MNGIPEYVQEYGDYYWTFPHLNQHQLQQYLDKNINPFYCVYMPVVDYRPPFKASWYIAIPTYYRVKD